MSGQSAAQDDYKYAAALALIFALIAGYFVWEAFGFQSAAAMIKEDSVTTTAMVVGKRKGGKAPSEVWLAFADAKGAEVRATAKFITDEAWDKYEPGDRIPVRYARADSSIVEIKGQYQSSMVGNRFMIGGACAVGALVALAFAISGFNKSGGGGSDAPPTGSRVPPRNPPSGAPGRTAATGSARAGFGRRA